MARLNAEWHRRHPMPQHATLDQRVRWHVAHARHCACREIPATMRAELKARRIPLPRPPAPR